MKVLLSSIGSRGDVQPLLALALELKKLGHEASLCVAPNFKEWIESYGVTCIPIGPDLKKLTGGTMPSKPVTPSKEQRKQLAAGTVRAQFQVLGEAVRDCDLIVAATALQIAARSIAETRKIPYVFAVYSPAVLPSPQYPPPNFGRQHSQTLPGIANRFLWMRDEQSFNEMFRETFNDEREKAGLPPVGSVRPYMFTDRPWLAADPALGPASPAAGKDIVQTGAWMLPDGAELPDELEEFLAKGAPPVYFGFGSMRTSEQSSGVVIEAARALGMRAILSQGWADLSLKDAGADCISIGEVNHAKLFPRVAAIVHHGGAGTTTTSARAGRPQVIVPHNYDQYYWARRVQVLGVGVQGPILERLSVDAITRALRECFQPEMTSRAQALAGRIVVNGAQIAAERLVREFG
jgi:vancomycin aglycone glucosyltransferase